MDFSVLIVVGLSFSIILLIKRLSLAGFRHLQDLMSVLLIGVITVELFYGWLYSTQYIKHVPHLLRFNTPLVFLIGPSIYLFVRANTSSKQNHWTKAYGWHFLPFIVIIIYFLPLYFSSASYKTSYIIQLYQKLPFDSWLIGGLRRLHQGIYLFSALLILNKFTSSNSKAYQSNWLIVGAFGVFWLLDVYRYFFRFDLLTGIIDTFLLSIIAIYLVYIQLSFPQQKQKYASSQLRGNELDQNATIIHQKLKSEKGYLHPKFTLKDLSEQTELSIHLLSQTINQSLKTNFNGLVNTYRVEEAIRLLQSDSTQHLTIEAISQKAGFNSVSSFNANFKKITGKSPKFYRSTLPES